MMKKTLKQILGSVDLKLSINVGFLQAEITFNDADKKAAWELYIEMLTRIITQPLPENHGDEKTALDSVYSLFGTTRDILKKYGGEAVHFSKVAIPVLNQTVRPFTAKWHKEFITHEFKDRGACKEFRTELEDLRKELVKYQRLLAIIAGVEDLTDLEKKENEHV